MKIQDFSQQSGLSAKTIRYYESIGILRSPQRAPNGYREYSEQDLERARFVAGARSLELSLDEVSELLAMQNQREAPCRTMLNQIKHKADEISKRILLLQQMEKDLRKLYKLGLTFPTDDIDGKNCICHLVKEHSNMNIRG
jgi:DNA-binding transcriptional MerR regulator